MSIKMEVEKESFLKNTTNSLATPSPRNSDLISLE